MQLTRIAASHSGEFTMRAPASVTAEARASASYWLDLHPREQIQIFLSLRLFRLNFNGNSPPVVHGDFVHGEEATGFKGLKKAGSLLEKKT